MSEFDRALYSGSAPATLRLEMRSDGAVRFRVTPLGGHEAVVDVASSDVDELVDNLRGRPR